MTSVFGIDIFKGNVRSQNSAPHFCLVIVHNGEVVAEEKGVSIPRLFRRLKNERPDILAVDSVQEIAASDKDLFSFLAEMPPETKLVQVTGDGVKMESLGAVAAKYSIKFDKTNSMEEAKASALVASFGYGFEVLAFEGVTTITISRGRSLGRGGWSQNRYVRKVHGNVKTRSREIEARLAEVGLSYSTESRTAFGGESRVIISVKAPRNLVPVANMKSGDVQVRVIPKRRDKISYVPLTKKTPYTIVGVDPGTTVGLSILDLNGNLLHTGSVRAQSPAEVIAEISRVGKPVIVATDKAEMPAGVEKIRRSFAATPWTPKKDILIREKYDAVKGYEFADDHERDSLAAAVLAYKSFQTKFDNIRKRVPVGTDIDFVLAGIARGQTLDKIMASQKSFVLASSIQDEVCDTKDVVEPTPQDEKTLEIARLEAEVLKLRRLAGSLSQDLESKDKAIRKLQRRLSLERSERTAEILASDEIASRDKELQDTKKALRKEERRCKNLRLRLERMKNYVALQAGDGCLAIKVMPILARDAVKSMDSEMGVNEGDIIYVLKIDGWGKSVLRDLADAKVKAVIFPKLTYDRAREQHLIDAFQELNLPALSGASLAPRVKGKIGVVNEAAFLEALSTWDAAESVYLKMRHHDEISGMVKEYQVQRRREVVQLGIDPSTYPYNQEVKVVQKEQDKKIEGKIIVGKKVDDKKSEVKKIESEKLSEVKTETPSETKDEKQNDSLVEKKKERTNKIADEIVKEKTNENPNEKIKSETEDVLTSVLLAYRKERQKELGRDDNG